MKKVVVFGGGTGLSTLLRGLKFYPIDISAIVSVSDDGRSTGKLRKEFNIPAVGDLRQVLVALSDTEPLVEDLLNYRFNTYTDLNEHTVGNLLLVASLNLTGSVNEGVYALSKLLNLKGNVLPLSDDNLTLMAKTKSGNIIEGEHKISETKEPLKKVYYKKSPLINYEVIKTIEEADYIIFSMGSLYTSIIPNIICKSVVEAIDNSKAKIMFVCNIMTQPGETDGFNVSDHINLINKYLGKKKIETIFVNNKTIDNKVLKKYKCAENKELVIYDNDNIKSDIKVILGEFMSIENNFIRHDCKLLASKIFIEMIGD